MEHQQGMYTGYTFERCIKDFPNERFELLDGTAYLMTPPSHVHQEISSNLVGELWSYLKRTKQPCRIYHAPTGLFFDEDEFVPSQSSRRILDC